jgi:hypothetical protein
MRLEGRNAKTLLVIEEEIDLGREKVAVIHRGFYGVVSGEVSEEALGTRAYVLAEVLGAR